VVPLGTVSSAHPGNNRLSANNAAAGAKYCLNCISKNLMF